MTQQELDSKLLDACGNEKVTAKDIADILKAGADPNSKSTDGQTPLHVASLNNPAAIGPLLAAGADIEALDDTGLAPIHVASEKSISILAAAGANINIRDEKGRTPLHHDTLYNLGTMTALIAAGADPDARDKKGETPLHIATRCGRIEDIQYLLDAGSDPVAKNKKGELPADITLDPLIKKMFMVAQCEREGRELDAESARANHETGRSRRL